MKKIIVAAVAMVGSAAGAQAADLPVKAPVYKAPVAQVYDWTGFYVGANAGLGFGREPTHMVSTSGNAVMHLGDLGAIGGVQAGYNWQFRNLLGFSDVVLGVEADIQGSGLEDSYSCAYLCGRAGFGYQQKLDWFGTVRGRIGLATGPVLSYVTGGLVYGNVKTNIAYLNAPAESASFSDTRTGWTIGSGVEASLGGNWTAKVEYLYLDLGSQSGISPNRQYAFSSDIREQIFRAGVNYRIGGNNAYVSAPAANWAGFYLGGNAGGATALNRSRVIAPNGAVFEDFNLSPDGFMGGVQIGYNFQAGNFVYGLEADFQGSSLKDDENCLFGCGANVANFDQKMQWFGTVRGRAGYTLGATLFYATGGLAYGNVKTTIQGVGGGTPFAASFDKTRTGYAVGGGIESPFDFLGLFGPNWTSKSEYLYINLGRANDTFAIGAEIFGFSTKVEQHTLRTGLNYHFNSPVVAKY